MHKQEEIDDEEGGGVEMLEREIERNVYYIVSDMITIYHISTLYRMDIR